MSVRMKLSDSCPLLSDRIWSAGRDLAALGNGGGTVELTITLCMVYSGDPTAQAARYNRKNTHIHIKADRYIHTNITRSNKDSPTGP